MKKKSKYASGGSPKPMTMAERVADRNRRMAQAMGDAPSKPKPAPRPAKPKPYAAGGPIMQSSMPMSSMRNFGLSGGAGSPMMSPPVSVPPMGANPMDGRPLRAERGLDPAAMRQRFAEQASGMAGRIRPGAPSPVGPGGGYKKGGKIDGCATRGMTKGRK